MTVAISPLAPDTGLSATGRLAIRQVRAGGFMLTEARYAAGMWIQPHTHSGIHLALAISGGTTERVGRREFAVRPGDVLVRDAQIAHSNMIGRTGAHALFVEWVGSGPGPLGEAVGAVGDVGTISSASAVRIGDQLMGERWTQDAGTLMVLEGRILALIGFSLRASRPTPGKQPTWVYRGRDQLLADLASPPPIADLARHAGVHPGHFYRAFRHAFEMSPAECLQQARIATACRKLRDGDSAIADIAADLGFADQSHFGRVFRNQIGLSPGAWRAAAGHCVTPPGAVPSANSCDA